MYILTNIEAEATHKVLTNLGPDISNELPEADKQVLRTLFAKLSTAINNGLPEDPALPGHELPTPPPVIDAKPPTPPTPPPTVDNAPPAGKPPKADHDLPEHAKPKK